MNTKTKGILISAMLQFHFLASHLPGWLGRRPSSGRQPGRLEVGRNNTRVARRKGRTLKEPEQAQHYSAPPSQPRKEQLGGPHCLFATLVSGHPPDSRAVSNWPSRGTEAETEQ